MIFQKAGFQVFADQVGSAVFLHSLSGKGEPAEFSKFVHCVLSACECPVFVTVQGKAERLYTRLGFTDTGERVEGHKVLVRFPFKETMN